MTRFAVKSPVSDRWSSLTPPRGRCSPMADVDLIEVVTNDPVAPERDPDRALSEAPILTTCTTAIQPASANTSAPSPRNESHQPPQGSPPSRRVTTVAMSEIEVRLPVVAKHTVNQRLGLPPGRSGSTSRAVARGHARAPPR